MFERDLDDETEERRERFRFWLTVGLGAILTCVVGALVLLLSRANDDYDRSLGWQAHSLEIISQTRSLDAALARAEAALGRFAQFEPVAVADHQQQADNGPERDRLERLRQLLPEQNERQPAESGPG